MLKRVLFFAIWLLLCLTSVFADKYHENVILNRVEVTFFTSAKEKIQKTVDTNIIIKQMESERSVIEFFKYDRSSSKYITVAKKSIPVSKTYTFSPGEKIYISAKFPNVYLNTNRDHEELKLTKSNVTSQYFTGVLKTSVDKQFKSKSDGILYVEDLDKITITKSESKNRANNIIASVDIIYSLQTLEDEIEQNSVWIAQSKLHYITDIGEYHKGILTITNQSDKDIKDAMISLSMPKELIIEKSSIKLNGVDSYLFKERNNYLVKVPNLNSKESVTFEYHFLVSLTDEKELAGHISIYHAKKNISNSLKLQITVNSSPSINPKRGFIVGKIKGLEKDKAKGMVLYLSNGYTATTDKDGRYHFEGVRAGLQVVQIDTQTIPEGYIPTVCRENARSAGSRISSFIDLKAGMVKQVDFCLKRSGKTKGGKTKKKVIAAKTKKTQKMPKYSSSDISKFKKKYKWLWPKHDGFVPSIGSIKTAILYPKELKLKLYLNGEEVDSLNSDGVLKNSKDSGAIALFRGIDIKDGDNYLKAVFLDKKSNIKHTMTRVVHFSGAPVKVKLLKEKSFLTADGKNSPLIALKMFDRYGYPVRESVKGFFYVDAPYKVDNGKDSRVKKSNYIVSHDGIAYIKLKPTTFASDVKIHIPTEEKELLISVKLEPKMRKWILVGFGEGSIGYRKISKDIKKTDDKKIYHDGRTSFFAKGTVLGDTLLTIAYDSGKEADLELFDRIDPSKYYTILGDASFQKSSAPRHR
jgi:hypothetical protein